MLDNFIFSVNIMLPMIILVFLGIYLRKVGFINKYFLSGANKIVFYVAIPILIFSNLFRVDIAQFTDFSFVVFVFLYTVGAILVIWGGAYFAFRKKAPNVIGAFTQGSIRGNAGIVALPLVLSIMGYENAALGILAVAILIPIYNVASVTVLVIHSEKTTGISPKALVFGILKNPPIIATVSGLVIAFFSIQLPPFVETTVFQLSGITTPLALMCLGGGMTFEGFGDRFKYSFMSSIIKVFLLPLGSGILAYLYGFRGDTLAVLILIQGVPSAVAGYVMVSEIGGDLYVAATNVLLTTIMSAFSLTLLIFVLRTLGMIA